MGLELVFVATCISAGTLLMEIVANYPIALASGMGESFSFHEAVLGMRIT